MSNRKTRLAHFPPCAVPCVACATFNATDIAYKKVVIEELEKTITQLDANKQTLQAQIDEITNKK
jgi:hypothetical protein